MARAASILIVDDQAMTCTVLRAELALEGYKIYTAVDGVEALEILQTTEIDLILADIAMPRMNGYQLFKSVRQDPRWVHIPFILVTARSMGSDIRYGKELGVDDYLTKPFNLEDLRASVAGKLRRSKQQTRYTAIASKDELKDLDELIIGNLRIHIAQHRLWVGDSEIALSVKEFLLLSYLARHPGKVISLEELCEVTHDLRTNRVEAGSLVYPLIRSLRSKLAVDQGDTEWIRNVRGVGYSLTPPFV